MSASKNPSDSDDGCLIFVMSFRHWRTGKLIRSKDGKPFCFRVKPKN